MLNKTKDFFIFKFFIQKFYGAFEGMVVIGAFVGLSVGRPVVGSREGIFVGVSVVGSLVGSSVTQNT